MRKSELFLFFFMSFFALSVFGADKVKTHIAKIPPKTIEEFNAQNPMAKAVKGEDYWDLAWHAKVADYGDMHSQFVMAQAYEFGKNTEPNPKKSLAFYKKAAAQGHFESCMRLGQIYTENKWVKEDPEQAWFWYEQAAKNGYVPAQMKLSDMAEHQNKPNYKKSYYWLATATKQLFPHEVDLESKAPHLTVLADYMTPEEYEGVLQQLEETK